jgi:hypothetical protein
MLNNSNADSQVLGSFYSMTPLADQANFIKFGSLLVDRNAAASKLSVGISEVGLNELQSGTSQFNLNLQAHTGLKLLSPQTLAESDSTTTRKLQFSVDLDAKLLTNESVHWALERVGSTAPVAADFASAVTGDLSFAAGQTNGLVDITILDDTLVEADEQYVLRLSGASSGLLLGTTPVSSTVTVQDFDKSTASVTTTQASVTEGNTGLQNYTFKVSLDQAAVSDQTIHWSVNGSGLNAANAADFAGGVLPTGDVTFKAGEMEKTITVQIAGDTVVEPDESFALTLSAPSSRIQLGANASATGIIASDDGSPMSGIVYNWKTHTLMSDVSIKLTPQVDGVNHLYELRNIKLTAAGDVTAEVWANLGTKSVQNLDFDLGLDSGVTGVFTADATTMTGFTAVDANTAGHVGFGAMSTTNSLTGSVKLGALSLDLPTGTTLSSVKFLSGDAGDSQLAAYGVKAGALLDTTDIHGAFDYQGLDAGLYSFELDKALTSAETGSQAISSADALAALKMAVGRNPNGDAAGTMAASPYQFIAADVNGDGRVSSADALAILKMAVRRSDALPREWLFVREDEDFWNEVTKTFTTTRTSVAWDNEPYDVSSPGKLTQNFVAVLKGDVNGSWVAPAGSEKLADSYFTDLVAHNPNSMQLSQWGIAPLAV